MANGKRKRKRPKIAVELGSPVIEEEGDVIVAEPLEIDLAPEPEVEIGPVQVERVGGDFGRFTTGALAGRGENRAQSLREAELARAAEVRRAVMEALRRRQRRNLNFEFSGPGSAPLFHLAGPQNIVRGRREFDPQSLLEPVTLPEIRGPLPARFARLIAERE